jgi:hypothetical protein
MKQDETFIIRARLGTKKSIYRDIEIKPSQSLHQLAQAIVQAFDSSSIMLSVSTPGAPTRR